ncbi:MAG: protein-methionine-sulfoxide reductase catalytic subunit MsrP [Geminicoccaceae bacterium]|nr:protein-methionine-sulfoxide reductase catalytic subunit MsrP [Geminicoccaceae bacterium]MCB9943208.1 protein-methionine-sulfoxide reductase catalytic subunit MsrP [Geminicoccaceae bacterium]
MLTKSRKSWEINENQATDEGVWLHRRALLKGLAVGSLLTPLQGCGSGVADEPPIAPEIYPARRNPAFTLDRDITDEALVTSYNNFHEFGSHKRIASAAQSLRLRPWAVVIDGMVDKEMTLDAEDLIRKMPVEERLYRHRCVEGWSIAVPWTGFPLRALIDMARPLSSAKYLRMETFKDSSVASGQLQFWYPWPYVEGLTMAEARNELAFISTGMYGKPMPRQNGAPLRLTVPWKYGFKSIKSIVRFSFTDERPVSFWEEIQASEYGFWANINPDVPHARWSQADEQILGTNEIVPTRIYNGYGEQVADLYAGLKSEKLFM